MARQPCDRKIGIVFALRDEVRGLERALSEAHTGTRARGDTIRWWIGGTELIVAVSGVGRKRCEVATEKLIREGASLIICAGLAAALDPIARVGDVFVASRIMLADDADSTPIPSAPCIVGAVPPGGSSEFVIRHSDVVTTDSVVRAASDKSRIFRASGAAALDMESYAAAEVCKRNNVPFAVIRSISDTADQDLPDEVHDLARIEGRPGQFAFTLTHPRIWPQLARLRAQARIASDNLGDVLGFVLLRLA